MEEGRLVQRTPLPEALAVRMVVTPIAPLMCMTRASLRRLPASVKVGVGQGLNRQPPPPKMPTLPQALRGGCEQPPLKHFRGGCEQPPLKHSRRGVVSAPTSAPSTEPPPAIAAAVRDGGGGGTPPSRRRATGAWRARRVRRRRRRRRRPPPAGCRCASRPPACPLAACPPPAAAVAAAAAAGARCPAARTGGRLSAPALASSGEWGRGRGRGGLRPSAKPSPQEGHRRRRRAPLWPAAAGLSRRLLLPPTPTAPRLEISVVI